MAERSQPAALTALTVMTVLTVLRVMTVLAVLTVLTAEPAAVEPREDISSYGYKSMDCSARLLLRFAFHGVRPIVLPLVLPFVLPPLLPLVLMMVLLLVLPLVPLVPPIAIIPCGSYACGASHMRELPGVGEA